MRELGKTWADNRWALFDSGGRPVRVATKKGGSEVCFRTVAWFDIYLLNDEFGPALQLVVDKTVVSSPFARSRLRTQEEKWRQ
jgi:hypothetical protein